MSLLELDRLSVTRGGRRVLDGIDLRIGAGDCVGLLGPNGAGKMTLLRAALGLVPSQGRSSLAALPPGARARQAAFLPQEREIAWPMSVASVVALGRLAAYVRDRRIPLEMCPTSNVHTGAAPSIEEHPIDLLRRLRFRVTVNTDNRLQSRTGLSRELHLLVTEAGWTPDDLRTVTVTAARHAFLHEDERTDLIDRVILPGHAPTAPGRHRA